MGSAVGPGTFPGVGGRVQRIGGDAYVVPEGRVLHGVLGGQGDAAEQDEEEDEVGEDGVVDNAVALDAEPARGRAKQGRRASEGGGTAAGSQGPVLPLHAERGLLVWGGGRALWLKSSCCWVPRACPCPHEDVCSELQFQGTFMGSQLWRVTSETSGKLQIFKYCCDINYGLLLGDFCSPS